MQDQKENHTIANVAPAKKSACSCCAPVSLGDDAGACEIVDGVQEVRITVKGGYSPSSITLAKGVPARLVFTREETSRCSEELLIPSLGVRQALPAHAETKVEFTPTEDGIFGFSCGMNMLRGELVIG